MLMGLTQKATLISGLLFDCRPGSNHEHPSDRENTTLSKRSIPGAPLQGQDGICCGHGEMIVPNVHNNSVPQLPALTHDAVLVAAAQLGHSNPADFRAAFSHPKS
eukprot:1142604-Pelagomonas_calceolata.AAC.1